MSNINLKTLGGIYYKNIINIKMLKINNFIKNFININNNFNNFRLLKSSIKTYFNYSILYDENIVNKNIIKCENDCYCNYDYKNINCTCDNTTDLLDINIYIEYFTYFPKIEEIYVENPNYSGKYYENFYINEKNKQNNDFVILPSAKYIKFNYINYLATYPDIIDEDFVKSIKNTFNIVNYNFSLLIKIPYDINQDNNFYCSNPKYFWSNQYSANIGDNNSQVYLVLTNSDGIPYNFKGKYDECTEKNNGLIYAIKLFSYYNL
jgi:hypothetical protein